MKLKWISASLFLLSSFLWAELIELKVGISDRDFSLKADGDFIRLFLKDGSFAEPPGKPDLPSTPIFALLPPNQKARSVTFQLLSADTVKLPAPLYPAQKPTIKPIPGVRLQPPEFTQPDNMIYGSAHQYPLSCVKLGHGGSLRGYSIAGVIFYPILYLPKENAIVIVREGKLVIQSEPTSYLSPRKITPHSLQQTEKLLKALVANPELLALQRNSTEVSGDGYDYIIVSPASLVSYLGELRELNAMRGLKDTVLIYEEAVMLYPGVDAQERLRNAIKELYYEYGPIYLLLIGDTELIASRWAFAMDCEAGFYETENQIHADYYYSCLDGNWNATPDDTFGMVDDSVDLLPELFVGRITVQATNPIADISSYLAKLISHQLNPSPGYLTKALFLGEILWDDPYPYTDAGIAKDMVGELFPSEFNIIRLYQSLGNENRESVIAELTAGAGVINHDGHAFIDIIGIGDDLLFSEDVDLIEHADRYGIMYSIGCWSAAFDYDCIAEHLIMNPTGGTIAFIGNNRYGWGSYGNPGYGYSDVYDYKFFDVIFNNEIYQLGAALALMKSYYAVYADSANLWRWHNYQINLLGEPATVLWHKEPESLVVTLPDTIPSDAAGVSVLVEDSAGLPLDLVQIVVTHDGEIIGEAFTNPYGSAYIAFTTTIEALNLTSLPISLHFYLYKPGYHPYASEIPVGYSGGVLMPVSWWVEHDELGRLADSALVHSTDQRLLITFKNLGSEPLPAGLLTLTQPDITLDPHEFIIPDLAPEDSFIAISNIYIPSSCLSSFRIDISADLGGNIFTGNIPMNALYPHPVAIDYLPYRRASIDTGDTNYVRFIIRNHGNFVARSLTLTLSAISGEMSIAEPILALEDLPPGSLIATDPIPIYIDSCGLMELAFTGANLSTRSDTLLLECNELVPIYENVEAGVTFTHSGINSVWHPTERHALFGSYCWGFYSESTGYYPPNAKASLISPLFTLPHSAILSFWLFYDVATYGGDGLYIKFVGQDEDTVLLDYLGSGGALDSMLTFSVGWHKYSYPLPNRGGESARIIFYLETDERDAGEGFYLDEIKVTRPRPAVTLTTKDVRRAEPELTLLTNPVVRFATLSYSLPVESELEVYDIIGRRRMELTLPSGQGEFRLDTAGLSAGLYFLRLKNEHLDSVHKLIIIR